jgi:glycosyltransferase involved in cell wall biosynthesis
LTVSRPVVFVEQFYWPDGWGGAELPRALTIAMARSGATVEVLCGTDQYAPVEGDAGPDPRTFGIRIRRVPGFLGGGIHRWKLLRQVWFYAWLLPALFLRRRPRLFIAQTNPPFGVVLTAIAARFWRCPMIIIAMDVYPDILVAYGALRAESWAYRMLAGMFEWSYRSASCIVSLGPVMTAKLRAKIKDAVEIVEISNWATGPLEIVRGAANRLRSELALPSGITILYSGNLGLGHEFDTLLDGFASAVRREPTICLVIVGKGRRLRAVREAVERLGIGDAVRFVDYLPADRLREGMGLADVAVVTLRNGYEGLIVPSKLFGYMARGLPVLYIGPVSDMDHYIQRARCGVALRCGDALGVADAIVALQNDHEWRSSLGAAGGEIYRRELAADFAIARYLALVSRVAGVETVAR